MNRKYSVSFDEVEINNEKNRYLYFLSSRYSLFVFRSKIVKKVFDAFFAASSMPVATDINDSANNTGKTNPDDLE